MVGEAFARKLASGQVDANAESADTWILTAPLLNLAARFREPPIADRKDEAGFLGKGNKVHWGNEAALRMIPAYERLKPNNLARRELDFWLVIENKLALLEGSTESPGCAARPATGSPARPQREAFGFAAG